MLPDPLPPLPPPNTHKDLRDSLSTAASVIDQMLIDVVSSTVDASPDAVIPLYGDAYNPAAPHPVSVWVDAMETRASAATSIIWQVGSMRNMSTYPPGRQTRCCAFLAGVCLVLLVCYGCSKSLMAISGVSLAISHAPPLLPLILYVPSKSLIEDIWLHAAQLTLHGSVAKDSDLFSILVTTIANCICPIHFRIPSEKSAPTSQAAYAHQLAQDVVHEHSTTHGTFLGLVNCAPPSCVEDDLNSLKELGTPSIKVTSDLTPTRELMVAEKLSPADVPLPTDTDSDSESHHGRSKVRECM